MKQIFENLEVFIPDNYKDTDDYVLQVMLPFTIEKVPSLNISVKLPYVSNDITGVDTHVLQLAEQQSKSGFLKPIVLVGSNDNFTKLFQEMNIGYIKFINKLSIFETIKNFGKLPFVNKIKVIHSHHNFSNYFVYALKDYHQNTYGKIPTVMTCHSWLDDNLMMEFFTYLNLYSYQKTDAVITVCNEHKENLTKKFNFDSKLVFNIINGAKVKNDFSKEEIDKFKEEYNIDKTKKTVAFVGRLSFLKRVDIFIKACSEIAKYTDANFVIVGNGEAEDELKELAKKLGIEERINFIGYVYPVDIVYSCIDILIHPSDAEGSPRTVIEAMSTATPVVSTNVGGLNEIIDGKNGFKVEREQYEEIAKYVVKMLTDENLLKSMSACAKQSFNNNYTLEVMQQKIDDVYRKIIKNKQ